MKRLLFIVFLVGCGGGSDGDDAPSQDVTVVFGRVTDGSGAGLSGVRVTGGGAIATTSATGDYQLTPPASGVITITFAKDGFLETRRSSPVLDRKPTALHAQLAPMGAAVQLDAEAGGEATGMRGASVVAPAGAFVDPMGASVAGMVDVHLTPLDPTNPAELNAVTENFTGRDGGSTTLLESFGMLEITVRQDGATLDVADGMALDITIPAPAGVADPPATVPLWSLDESANIWVREGEATFDADAGVYRAQIAHMSAWNVDQPAEATCITGVVKTPDGDALPGARITASGVDYSGTSGAASGADGRFYVAVRMNSTVTVTAAHAAGGGAQRTVMSGSAPTGIPPGPADDCLDVGEWVVEQGVVTIEDGDGSRTIDCRDVGPNPFAGSCADGLFGLFECYRPQGTCDIRFQAVGEPFEIRYSNGSRVSALTTEDGELVNISYFGPGGNKCADAEPATVDGEERFNITYNGQTWGIPQDDDENAVTIVCPSGERVSYPQAELDAVSACGLGAGDEGGQQTQCTINGMDPNPQPQPDPGPGGMPAPGSQGTLCMANGECNSGLTCCILPQANGQGICFDPAICEQAMMQGN